MKKINLNNCIDGVYYINRGFLSFTTACRSNNFLQYVRLHTKPKRPTKDFTYISFGKLLLRKIATYRTTTIYFSSGRVSLDGLATATPPANSYSYSTSGRLTINGLFSTTFAGSHSYSTSGKLSFNGLATCSGTTDSSLLTASDFTYLGAYVLPQSPFSGGQSVYGSGLAMRTENSDGINPLHFLSAAYGGAVNHGVYEWRDTTPGTGGSNPLNQDNYPTATVVKTYDDIYSGKKRIIYQGIDTPLTSQLDGDFGLYWDETDSRLYWSYGFGYSNDTNSWCLGYSTLNYSANTGTGFGPWRLSGQSWKALQSGLTNVPSSYATTYLSGKRLAIGFGGYYSIVGSCDASLGPSLTAIDAITAPEESDLPCTPLVGYWPTSSSPSGSNGRGNRPEPSTVNASAEYSIDPDWPATKFTWNDRVRAGVWIDTGTKRGMLFFGRYGRGYTQYVASGISSSKFGHYWAIYDPNDFTPVSGTARYNIQPTEIYDYQYPMIDYTQVAYAGGSVCNITSITSTNGQPKSTTGHTVVTAPSHGLTSSSGVEITGASDPIYNAIWVVTVLDSDTFGIHNPSLSSNWNGATATGGTAQKIGDGVIDKPLGACYDPNTGKLYLAISVTKGFNGLQSRVFMLVYQVNG